jgi:hypothetical protein
MTEYEPADETKESTKRIRAWAPNARILTRRKSMTDRDLKKLSSVELENWWEKLLALEDRGLSTFGLFRQVDNEVKRRGALHLHEERNTGDHHG